MEYYCSNFKKAVNQAKELSLDEQMQIINNNPNARLHFAALLLMFNMRNTRKINIDDWEFDLENQLLKSK